MLHTLAAFVTTLIGSSGPHWFKTVTTYAVRQSCRDIFAFPVRSRTFSARRSRSDPTMRTSTRATARFVLAYWAASSDWWYVRTRWGMLVLYFSISSCEGIGNACFASVGGLGNGFPRYAWDSVCMNRRRVAASPAHAIALP